MSALLDEPNPLLHVLEIVHDSPGLSLDALRERAGLGWGSVYQRVDLLKEAGLLREERDGKRKRLFAAAPPDAEACRQASVGALLGRLNRDTARRVARAVLEHPGMGAERLAQLVGIPPRSVYLHIKQLVALGLVEREGTFFRSNLRPTERLRSVLEREEFSIVTFSHRAGNLESSTPLAPLLL